MNKNEDVVFLSEVDMLQIYGGSAIVSPSDSVVYVSKEEAEAIHKLRDEAFRLSDKHTIDSHKMINLINKRDALSANLQNKLNQLVNSGISIDSIVIKKRNKSSEVIIQGNSKLFGITNAFCIINK